MESIIIWLSAQRLLVCTNGCMKTVYLELHNDDIYYYDNQFFIMFLTSYFYGFVKLCMHVCTKQNYNVISKNQNIAAYFIISMISKLNSHQTFICQFTQNSYTCMPITSMYRYAILYCLMFLICDSYFVHTAQDITRLAT